MARSTFRSQNVQNTPFSDHLEVKMSKKCTPLWRKAHFEVVKMYKALHVRATFGGSDVEKVHAVVAGSTFRSENVQNTRGSDHFWRFRCRFAASLHYTTLRYITPHSNILHYITLHYTPRHYNYNYTTRLHYTITNLLKVPFKTHQFSNNYQTYHPPLCPHLSNPSIANMENLILGQWALAANSHQDTFWQNGRKNFAAVDPSSPLWNPHSDLCSISLPDSYFNSFQLPVQTTSPQGTSTPYCPFCDQHL